MENTLQSKDPEFRNSRLKIVPKLKNFQNTLLSSPDNRASDLGLTNLDTNQQDKLLIGFPETNLLSHTTRT